MESDIRYIEIPKPPKKLSKIENDEEVEVKEKLPKEALGISIVFLTLWLFLTIKENLHSIWNVILGLGILLFIIYLIYKKLSRSTILVVSSKGIFHRNKLIKWTSILEINCKVQDVGEYDTYELLISTTSGQKITINLKWLNKSPESIIKIIGDYYWSNTSLN